MILCSWNILIMKTINLGHTYSFGEPTIIPLAKDVVLPDVYSPYCDERIHGTPHPKLVANSNSPSVNYGVDDVTKEYELPSMSGSHF